MLTSGPFARAWGDGCVLGREDEELAAPDRHAVDAAEVEEHLAADTDCAIKAVLVAHVDTGTSVRNDIEAIRVAMDAADHPAR